jgi:hypothetical protein
MNHPNKRYLVSMVSYSNDSGSASASEVFEAGGVSHKIVNAPHKALAYFSILLGKDSVDEIAKSFTFNYDMPFSLDNMKEVIEGYENDQSEFLIVFTLEDLGEATIDVSTAESDIGLDLTLEVF